MSKNYSHIRSSFPKAINRHGSKLALCLGILLFSLQPLFVQANESRLEDETDLQASATLLPRAKSIDLDEPVEETGQAFEQESEVASDEPAAETDATPPLLFLGTQVLPGTSTRLAWSPSQSFESIASPTSVLVVKGANTGPVLCLTAAVHGDELNGIEIVRRVMYALEAEKLSGTVIGVPIVNLQGFQRSSRYLTDRRDLNRFFPGNTQGSSASRIAYSFFREVISHCDALVDIHTGSFHRINLPQLRADLSQPEVVKLTQGFGATAVLHSTGAVGTLRRAATDNGIPAVTLEAGGSMHLEEEAVEHGVKGINTLISTLGMGKKMSLWGPPEPVYYHSIWVRANRGGILFSDVELGEKVDKGDLLGTVTDPITNVRSEITAPFEGRILGMAVNQVVMPGFAAFRIGIQRTDKDGESVEEVLPNTPEDDSPDLASSENFTPSTPDRERSE
ncbi:MAG: succinylglutamate desuccinylase/aspartoacylase family protein [Pseudomonadales bacterium]